MIDQLPGLLTAYGLPLNGLVVCCSALGLPLPASLLLASGGSLVAAGELGMVSLLLCGVISASIGDGIGYWVGKRARLPLPSNREATCRVLGVTEAGARRWPDRWGGSAALSTRCVFTAAGPFVNLAAGKARYPYRLFLLYGLLGEAIWVGAYAGPGYALGSNLQAIEGLTSKAAWALALVIAAVAALLLLVRAPRSGGTPNRGYRVQPGPGRAGGSPLAPPSAGSAPLVPHPSPLERIRQAKASRELREDA